MTLTYEGLNREMVRKGSPDVWQLWQLREAILLKLYENDGGATHVEEYCKDGGVNYVDVLREGELSYDSERVKRALSWLESRGFIVFRDHKGCVVYGKDRWQDKNTMRIQPRGADWAESGTELREFYLRYCCK